jgi:hypothetical protein
MKTSSFLKSFSGVFALILIGTVSAQADVILPPKKKIPPSRPSSQWSQGQPTLIKKSQTCANTGVCLGSYERLVYGPHGEVSVLGKGHAFCNAIGGQCPTSDACITDEEMTIESEARVADRDGRSTGTDTGSKPNSQHAN